MLAKRRIKRRNRIPFSQPTSLSEAEREISHLKAVLDLQRKKWGASELEARALIKLKNSYDLALEYHKDTNVFAQSSIRMALIFNGGAILVLMNFLGSLIRSTIPISGSAVWFLIASIVLYILGAVLGIAASAFSYFGNAAGTNARAFEAAEPLLRENPEGYREFGLPRHRMGNNTISVVEKFIKDNHVKASNYRKGVIISMLTSYLIFGIATVISSLSIVAMLSAKIIG